MVKFLEEVCKTSC